MSKIKFILVRRYRNHLFGYKTYHLLTRSVFIQNNLTKPVRAQSTRRYNTKIITAAAHTQQNGSRAATESSDVIHLLYYSLLQTDISIRYTSTFFFFFLYFYFFSPPCHFSIKYMYATQLLFESLTGRIHDGATLRVYTRTIHMCIGDGYNIQRHVHY